MSGPLRIRRGRKQPEGHERYGSDAQATEESPVSEYARKLVLLVPAEALAVYLAGYAVIPPGEDLAASIWFAFGLLATIAVRARLTAAKAERKGPQWSAVLIAAFSFTVWTYSMARQPFHDIYESAPYAATLTVVAWTFVAPMLVKGD